MFLKEEKSSATKDTSKEWLHQGYHRFRKKDLVNLLESRTIGAGNVIALWGEGLLPGKIIKYLRLPIVRAYNDKQHE